MIKKQLYLVSLLFLMLPTFSYAGCAVLSNDKLSAVKEPLVQLLQIEDVDAQYGYVPTDAIKYIDNLKLALIALINERVACENNLSINPTQVQQDLLNALQLSELAEAEAIYGYDLKISVDRPKNTPNLMVVQAGFGIPCGDDNILLVYRFRGESWHLDLVWKSKPYNMITGAFSSYIDHLVLPANKNESTKVLALHSSADCTTNWQPLVFDVIKLADDHNPQMVLMHQKIITYRGRGLVNINKLENGFELQASVAMLDPDLGARRSFYRYRIDNNKIIREQPLAKTPRDFVDEWLILGKEELERFSNSENTALLLQQQAKLKDRGGFYGATKYCKKEELYEVEVIFNGTKEMDAETLQYFYVKPIKNGYLMQSIASYPNKRCYTTGGIN